MAEFTYIPIQEVNPSRPIPLNTTIGCSKGCIVHRNGSGIVTLRGITNSCFARYQVTFNGNIAVPTGETVGPISIAISIDGEPLESSEAIVTPAAVDNYFNVTSTAFVTVPKGCCFNVSVENTSDIPINVQKSNLVVVRVA